MISAYECILNPVSDSDSKIWPSDGDIGHFLGVTSYMASPFGDPYLMLLNLVQCNYSISHEGTTTCLSPASCYSSTL